MVKSIGVVVGSYVLSVVLVLASDPLLSRIFPGDFVRGHIPSTTALAASTVFFSVVAIFCAWVCARFSSGAASKHVLWFFVLGEVMGLAFTVPGWNNGWPHWYGLSWLAIWPIACWIGLQMTGRARAQAAAAGS